MTVQYQIRDEKLQYDINDNIYDTYNMISINILLVKKCFLLIYNK